MLDDRSMKVTVIIDDGEAEKIQALADLRKKQQEAKNKPKGEKKDGEEKEEENIKQKPNVGNGGQTESYVWMQSLEEVTVVIPLPMRTSGRRWGVH